MISTVKRGSKHANRRTTRHQGGQPGNRNAWKHGGRSAAAMLQRRIIRAELKMLAWLAVALGLLHANDVKFRPLRADQLDMLKRHRPLFAEGLQWALCRAPVKRVRGRKV